MQQPDVRELFDLSFDTFTRIIIQYYFRDALVPGGIGTQPRPFRALVLAGNSGAAAGCFHAPLHAIRHMHPPTKNPALRAYFLRLTFTGVAESAGKKHQRKNQAGHSSNVP